MATPKRKPQAVENGARFGGETLTFVDANEAIRPLRDQIVVEPMDVVYSKIIHVKQGDRPFRGTIRAVGPGHYPKRYDHPDKHKRSKMWDSTRFQPTQVKVGDVVELGGHESNGYAFEQFLWGDKLHIWAREADVACIVEPESA